MIIVELTLGQRMMENNDLPLLLISFNASLETILQMFQIVLITTKRTRKVEMVEYCLKTPLYSSIITKKFCRTPCNLYAQVKCVSLYVCVRDYCRDDKEYKNYKILIKIKFDHDTGAHCATH